MSTIKADNISPVGSILNLTAPVAGLSVASGLTVGGVAYFSGGATFAGTTDHSGVARFSGGVTASQIYGSGGSTFAGNLHVVGGVTFAGTSDHTGVARFAAGVTMSSSLDVNGTLKVSGQITHGSAPVAVPSGTAPIFGVRAWVRFTRSGFGADAVVTIRGQGNVSSVTSDNNGVYTITFNTALPANYAIAGVANEANSATNATGGGGGVYQSAVNLFSNADCTTTSCKITFANIDSTNNTQPEVCSLIFVG